jgi:hypothetical protein
MTFYGPYIIGLKNMAGSPKRIWPKMAARAKDAAMIMSPITLLKILLWAAWTPLGSPPEEMYVMPARTTLIRAQMPATTVIKFDNISHEVR